MKLLLGLLAIAPLGVGVIACGSAAKNTTSIRHVSSTVAATTRTITTATTPAQGTRRNDNDGDYDHGSDDEGWGQPATAAERRAITALVKGYYAAVATNNGATACSLMYSLFAEEIPELYGEPPGDPSLRGDTCAKVMAKVFTQRRRQLAAGVPTLKVSNVRLKKRRGLVLLRFKGTPEREIHVHRERRVWKIDQLLDDGLG